MSSALAGSGIKLGESETELALAETRAVLAAAGSPKYRDQLDELAERIESCFLDDRHALTLEPILELALQAGRFEGTYGPPVETPACRPFPSLPRGKALRRMPEAVAEPPASSRETRWKGGW